MRLLILTYHYFHTDRPYGIKVDDYPFSMATSRFERHCRQLKEAEVDIIDPISLTTIADGDDKTRRVLITIDDGHQSIEDHAAEILLEYNIRPVLFVITGRVGKDHYLTWSSLRNLASKGMSIQSHSATHRRLTTLDDKTLVEELVRSQKEVKDNIGISPIMLAAPMGRIDKRVRETAKEAGYDIIMTSFTGINCLPEDLGSLRRFQVKDHLDDLPLAGYFSPASKVRIMGSAKNAAKRIRNLFE